MLIYLFQVQLLRWIGMGKVIAAFLASGISSTNVKGNKLRL